MTFMYEHDAYILLRSTTKNNLPKRFYPFGRLFCFECYAVTYSLIWLINSSSPLQKAFMHTCLERSRLNMPMIDFALTMYLPEKRSISKSCSLHMSQKAFTCSMVDRQTFSSCIFLHPLIIIFCNIAKFAHNTAAKTNVRRNEQTISLLSKKVNVHYEQD